MGSNKIKVAWNVNMRNNFAKCPKVVLNIICNESWTRIDNDGGKHVWLLWLAKYSLLSGRPCLLLIDITPEYSQLFLISWKRWIIKNFYWTSVWNMRCQQTLAWPINKKNRL